MQVGCLIGSGFNHGYRFRRQPIAFKKVAEARLHKPFVIRRIEKGEGERLSDPCWFRSEIGSGTAVNPCDAKELQGVHIGTNGASRGVIGFDEQAKGSPPRNRLKAQCA